MKIQGTELQKAGYFLTEVKGLCDNDFMDSGMIEAIAKLIVGYNELNTTTQPQPKLSAEDIDKLVEKYELNVDSFTSCFLVDKDILINICNEYRNQPIEVIAISEDAASIEACRIVREHYIGLDHPNIIDAGDKIGPYDDAYIIKNYPLEWSLFMDGWKLNNQPIEVKHPRTEQEEAEEIQHKILDIAPMSYSFEVDELGAMMVQNTISALQLRGLSTTFEEKVLTILKGR